MENNKQLLKRRMMIMLISVLVIFSCVFMLKGIKSFFVGEFIKKMQNPMITVSAMPVDYSSWQPQYTAVANLRAVLGVNVTTEAAGMVQTIYFKPGMMTNKNNLLVQLNIDADTAQLHALQASAALAKTTYTRDKAQYAIHAISKAALDTDAANVKNTQAQVDQQVANIAKKTIHAPFAGKLGISNVNPGQYINPGDKITSLETLNPIYADFYVPQSAIGKIRTGQTVAVNNDSYPNETFNGKISTIDSALDSTTRNVEVEATIDNPKQELMPGMFASAVVKTGQTQPYLTLPQTAISFNSYGEIVYILKPTDDKYEDKPIYTANQTFVTTGDTRGDQITVTQGLKKGDLVVTSGQLKLKNGSLVVIDNSLAPSDNAKPVVVNE